MKVSSAALIALIIALTAVSPRVAQATKVVITAPDPTCPTSAPYIPIPSGPDPTVTVDGTTDNVALFSNCTGSTINELFMDITVPTSGTFIGVTLEGAAFDELFQGVGGGDPFVAVELVCDTGAGSCTGLLNSEAVVAIVSTPEPAESALLVLGIGVSFLGLGGRKRLQSNRI